MTALEQAIKKAGGVTKLAKQINYSRAAIYLWSRVPAELVVQVEQASGVPREKLRPDLYRTHR